MQPTPIHAPMQELSFEMFHDPTTSKWIRAAERAKERAVLGTL